MGPCKKCGGGPINGPTYTIDTYSGEVLRYRCGMCGYQFDKPCADKIASNLEAMAINSNKVKDNK